MQCCKKRMKRQSRIAEIKSSPDTDIDSVPGNTDLSEDDIATSCFSVPIPFYSGDQYTVEVPAPFSYGTGIIWYRNNLPIGTGSPYATVNGDIKSAQSTPF